MIRRVIPLLCLCAPFVYASPSNNKGFFDIGIGPMFIEDVVINSDTTEYYPGLAIQSSFGLAYRNGLGLGLQYHFNYNMIKALAPADDVSTELVNYAVILNFMYTALPKMDVTFFMNAGPALVVNTDMKLRATAESETDTTATTTDAAGTVTQVVTTVDNSEAADPYETHDNFVFGYQLGGGIEYRQSKHTSAIFQLNYLNTQIFSSTYNTVTDRPSSYYQDDLEGFTGTIAFRYYI